MLLLLQLQLQHFLLLLLLVTCEFLPFAFAEAFFRAPKENAARRVLLLFVFIFLVVVVVCVVVGAASFLVCFIYSVRFSAVSDLKITKQQLRLT